MPKVKSPAKEEEAEKMQSIPLAKNQPGRVKKAKDTVKTGASRGKTSDGDVKKAKAELNNKNEEENVTDADTGSKKENATKTPAKRAAPSAYQFKVSLSETDPLIWRRILVPKGFTFAELHTTIKEAMGWKGGHHHGFRIFDPRKKTTVNIGPRFFDDGLGTLDENSEKILKYFPKKTNIAEYEYDFGDGWIHEVLFEGEVPRNPIQLYPQCTDGARACPPEDCGGVPGYENLCKIMKNSKHPEHADMKSWLRDVMGIKRFTPDKFDAKKIKFSLVKSKGMWTWCPPKFKGFKL